MHSSRRLLLFTAIAVISAASPSSSQHLPDTRLSLSSNPTGAIVYLDGAFAGLTPLSVTAEPGAHRVRVTKPGYVENSRLVTVHSGTPNALDVSLTARPVQSPPAQTAALKIVVLEGEDAVNVVQQRTAVAPLVEVRDRNDQPVAGAIVTFTIRSGRATFNGARTLTLTTNTAGRAAATGFTPTGTGAVQIGASAAFNGQTAVVAIAQTNVATAAQAAAVTSGTGTGAGAGSGTAAGGGAAAGGSGTAAGGTAAAAGGAAAGGAAAGGGLSVTTIGIIGGAAAGGALAAKKVADSGDSSSSSQTFVGSFSLTASGSCKTAATGTFLGSQSEVITGTMTLEMDQSGGKITGNGKGTFVETAKGTNCTGLPNSDSGSAPLTVTGTPANITASFQITDTGPSAGNPNTIVTDTTTIIFTGALNGSVISGTLSITLHEDGPFLIIDESGTAPVTLTPQ